MPAQGVLAYESGAWEIDLARQELRLRGHPVPLGGRAFAIVEVLIRSAGKLVAKDDLMSRVWPSVIVGDNTLQVHMSAVRKALGGDRWMLKTTTGRGYRLLGDWKGRQESVAAVTVTPAATQVRPSQTNLPAAGADLIGRDAVVQQLRDLLSAYRIVTLTGPGGIGKTTLALKVARRVLGEFADGGWLVELASLADPGLVPSAVAQVLRLGLGGGDITAETVARTISDRHLLLVLDNCEHLIDAVAILAEMLLRLCPRVTILMTSREVLRTQGEYVFPVPPLAVPAPGERGASEILGHSAPELFIARANELGSDFSSNATNLATIAAICRHLDGIPLAIEFAAARAAALGVELVAEGLRDRLALLTSGRRTALPRHRTLRATLDWSYALLPEDERRLLRCLAVFPAGFTLDAAFALMYEAGANKLSVMDGIMELVTKSLVTFDGTEVGSRWRLLETTRAYALQKLIECGEIEGAQRRHAAYFGDLFALPLPGARSRLPNEDLTRRVREIDNVRAALDWSFSPDGDIAVGIHLTAAYAPVWLHMSLIGECRDRCERALFAFDARPELSARLQMELQIALGSTLIVTLGSPDQAETVLTKALATADRLNEPDPQARALAALSTAQIYHRNYDGARAALERLRQVADQLDDRGMIAVADRRIGIRLLMAGRLREAQDCFERLLRSPMPSEDQRPEFWNYLGTRAMARAMLARTLCLRGFAESAHREAQVSVDEVRAMDHPLSICRVLNLGLCRIAAMTGDFVAAGEAIAQSIEVATRLNAPIWQAVGQLLEGKLAVERGDFARGAAVLEDAFATCGRAGWRISYPEFKGSLAAAYAGLGQTGEALSAVDEAIASSGPRHGQTWYLPELLRIKGEVLLRADGNRFASTGEDCLNQAAEMAHEQAALFWELRVALSLTRLRMTQGRKNEAIQVLAPVYDRFTEGFGTTDMRSATELLRSLSASHPD
jgi:predicted ATPase/DNA-binding winged helix-turn-helix (wHTH) protein